MTPEEMVIVADKSTSMKDVLNELGYQVWKTPLQIPCPVHKLGQETRPSARIYEDDRSVYCFYCVVQYGVTEVWAAMRSVDRGIAAEQILSKWPVAGDEVSAILRKAKEPYHPPLTEVYLVVLERHLLCYRGVAEFKRYRKWAKACDEFIGFINSIPEESREIAIQAFLERLNSDLQLSESVMSN